MLTAMASQKAAMYTPSGSGEGGKPSPEMANDHNQSGRRLARVTSQESSGNNRIFFMVSM